MKDKNRTDPLDLARRIRAAGRPIYIAEDDGESPCIPSDGLRVRQVGGVFESAAFDCGSGTGFKIYLVITSNLPNFAISCFDLELPWQVKYLQWLEDPLLIGGSSRCYRFGGDDYLEFERSDVINHYADVTRPFSPGGSVRGFLLAFGYNLIPEEFPHGATIPSFLLIYDQFGRQFRAPVKLWADRSKKNLRRRVSGVPRKGGLLDKRDPITNA